MLEETRKHVGLGQRIKERRQVLKFTQQDLAQSLGTTPQHISAIEQEKWTPSIPLLAKLAEQLGVSIDYLVSGRKGIITDPIAAIKADESLNLEAKRALITLVKESRSAYRYTQD